MYALAATIYYCLTGRKPPQAMDRLVEDELVPPRNLGVDLTEKQERALLRGLSTMQSRRYRSMEEFHTALYLDQPVPPPPPPPPPPPGPDDGGDDGPKVKKRAPLDWIKAHWQLTAGICAAALLCVTGLALWFSGGEGSPAPEQDGEVPAMNDEPLESDPAPADGSGQTVQTVYELTATNETSLYNLLENDTVGAIIIPEGAGFIVKQAVTLTKKLRVEPNASINFWNLLQVNEGGSVEIAGNVGCDGLLHVGGGSVNVKSKGSLWASMLWLEREEGMTCAEDGEINVWGENPMKGITDEYSYSRYVQVDEEALFANAATVRTAEDFIAKCGGGSPIVVEGNITVPDMVELRVPLRIAGGAALDASLQMEGGTIVNHGTLLGRIEMFGGQTGLARNVLVNQGTMDGELHSDFGTVINLGEIKTRDVVRQTGLVNLGTMEITGLLEIQGNRIMNGGTLTIAGEGLSLYGGSGLNNFGTITVEDGARLESCADFRLISGGLAVHPGGLLVNRGALWFEDAGQDFQLAVETGGEFRNDGVFLYREDSLDLAEGAVQGDGHRIPFSWYTDWGTKGDVRFVSNESGLRAALADDRCSLVIWNHDMPKINLNGGELVVTKGLVLQGADRDRRADFNTGGLTVSGENAFFIGNNVDFHGYPLTVENGAAALFDGEYFGTGDITVTDGGALYSAGGTPDPVEEREIVLSSGGRLVNVSGIVLNNCVLRIDGGFLFNYNNLELNGCQIENSGFLESYWACLRTDGDSSLVNRGEINIRGWEWMTDLDGELTNHGQMTFGGTHRISGSLVNQEDGRIVLEWEDHPLQAAGRLENLGTIQGARGAYVETVDGGVFTGNQVSYD